MEDVSFPSRLSLHRFGIRHFDKVWHLYSDYMGTEEAQRLIPGPLVWEKGLRSSETTKE